MTPTRIFLDLDDVLNCFTPYVLSELGCGNDPYDYASHPRESGFDIVDAANRLHPERVWTKESFWREIKREHWASVPRSREFHLLLLLSTAAVGAKNVFILTQATLDPDCLAGKKQWIERRCPHWLRSQYLVVGHDCKRLCAQPGSLLIDDNEENVVAFRDGGGRSLIMPRPWNSLFGIQDTYAHLINVFRLIFGERLSI